MRANRARGASLLELLFALAISSAVLAMTLPPLHGALKFSRDHQDLAKARAEVRRAASALEAAVYASRHLFALDALRWHRGELRLPNAPAKQIPLAAGSVALSVLDVDPQVILRVVNRDRETFQLCASSAGKPSAGENHWLALGLAGPSLLHGRVRSARVTECSDGGYLATMRAAPLPLFSTSSAVVPRAVVLVRDLYSLYLDPTHTLRRISHLTSEHQPLARDIGNLNLTVNAPLMQLTVEHRHAKVQRSVVLSSTPAEPHSLLELLQ